LHALSAGPARPIETPVPLKYELAWGGLDLSQPDEPLGEPRNTVGRGVAHDVKALVGEPAAQLEDPEHPIGGRTPRPACFGALHRHWEPRSGFAGTHDQRWMDTRMPLPPEDRDPRFEVTAPPDQWLPKPLRGDEPIEIVGATPSGRWTFRLPRIHPGFASWTSGARSEHRTHLDTVLVDADALTVELTWRAAVPLPKKYELLEKVLISEKRAVW
jgi:hypothetical protein